LLKILNDKIYFNTAKISRTTLLFRASASFSKTLNEKYMPEREYFQGNSFFRASASFSKILDDEKYFNSVKNSRTTLFLSVQAQVPQKS